MRKGKKDKKNTYINPVKNHKNGNKTAISGKNMRNLVLVMSVVLVVSFSACLIILIKGADNHFLNSVKLISSQINNLIQVNDSEKNDLQNTLKDDYISQAKAISYILDNNPGLAEDYDELCKVADLMNIDEVNIFGQDGLISYSTVPEYVGFSIYSGGQVSFFEPMMKDHSLELCQDLTPNTKEGKLIMYAAVWCSDCIVQIGISPEHLLESLKKNDISKVLDNVPIENGVYYIYDTDEDKIVSSTDSSVLNLSNEEYPIDFNVAGGKLHRSNIDGIKCVYALFDYDKYKIGISEPESSIYHDVKTNAILLFVFLALGLLCIFLLFNSISHQEKRNEQKYVKELQDAADQLSNYKRAVLSDALISLEVNLSSDTLYYGVWKDDFNNIVPLEKIVGLSLPCSYDEYIKIWNERFVKNIDMDSFSGSTDREYILKTFEQGINEITFDYEAKTISGRNTWLRRSICMAKNQYGDVIAYTSVKDISDLVDRKKSEESYIRALATDFDSLAVVSFGENKTEDKIYHHSRVSGEILGMVDDNTAGEVYFSKKLDDFKEYVHPDDKEKFWENTRRERIIQSFANGKNHSFEFRIMKLDGSDVYFQFRFIPLRNEYDEIKGMIACLRNIDEETRKEYAIRQEIIDSKLAAESANQAKTTFLFNMSHDIRTPMNAIIGFTDIAEKNIDDKERVIESLKKVRMSGNHLLSLINDILDMSRIEAGTVNIEEEPICMEMAKDNLYSILNGSAEEKNIVFTSVVDDSVVHNWFLADRLHMMRVLTNVISNSVKYTEPGGKISLLAQELPCAREGYAHYRYTVSDTGTGMSKEFLAHVFEPFSRAQSATKSGIVGTGLGMAITKQLVETMGGTISIESELGIGTTVYLDFENKITEPVELNPNISEDFNFDLEGKKVLLVEDNELNREIAVDILEEKGIIVDIAEDGDIAVEKMRNAEDGQYDLILMDIQMPRMNGYEATKEIRKLPQRYAADIPIIAMTANAFDEDKRNAFDAGMNGHLAKPINVSKLFSAISEITK